MNMGFRVLELLSRHKPAFQLKSGTAQLASSEGLLSRNAVRTDHIDRASHACSMAVLEFLTSTLTADMTTIETGGGWSTCVFAGCAGKHYCVNPDVTANELVEGFLREHEIPCGHLHFMHGTSDAMLPTLAPDIVIDVAFIDGCHSFPLPVIDWYYIDLHMKQGAIVILDDTHINAVAVVRDFLATDPAYEKVRDIGKAAVFRKIRDARSVGWAGQPFNKAPA